MFHDEDIQMKRFSGDARWDFREKVGLIFRGVQ
jgi:hypothetical protein